MYRGLYWGYVGGLYIDTGKENGNYCLVGRFVGVGVS